MREPTLLYSTDSPGFSNCRATVERFGRWFDSRVTCSLSRHAPTTPHMAIENGLVMAVWEGPEGERYDWEH